MSERHGQQRLRVDPSVGDNPNEVPQWPPQVDTSVTCQDPKPEEAEFAKVLRRQRLRDGDREVKGVLFLSTTFLQHEHLLVEDLLAVHVLSR